MTQTQPPSSKKVMVCLTLHPDDYKRLGIKGRQSRMVALALAVLELAPEQLIDKARAIVAKRDLA